VTVGAYLVLLGWHRPDRSYETWRILALGGVLAALAVGYGWRGYFLAGSAMQAIALTVVWTVDALSDPSTEDDGLLLIGLLSALVGTAAGALCVSRLAQALRDALVRRSDLRTAVNDFNNEQPSASP
jgi:glucose-6-phosphate-specific signal transduction histidine kinase